MDVLEKTKPILNEKVCVRNNLAVDFIEALAMEINGHIKAIGDVELDDEKKAAKHTSLSQVLAGKKGQVHWLSGGRPILMWHEVGTGQANLGSEERLHVIPVEGRVIWQVRIAET